MTGGWRLTRMAEAKQFVVPLNDECELIITVAYGEVESVDASASEDY